MARSSLVLPASKLRRTLRDHGWQLRRTKAGHAIYAHADGTTISLPVRLPSDALMGPHVKIILSK